MVDVYTQHGSNIVNFYRVSDDDSEITKVYVLIDTLMQFIQNLSEFCVQKRTALRRTVFNGSPRPPLKTVRHKAAHFKHMFTSFSFLSKRSGILADVFKCECVQVYEICTSAG
jgi:hypothetical protein